jgi:hypothetical protein
VVTRSDITIEMLRRQVSHTGSGLEETCEAEVSAVDRNGFISTISRLRWRGNSVLRRSLCLIILALYLVFGSSLAVPPRPVRASTLPPGFVETLVAGTFRNPTSVKFAPDGRIFVTEKGGLVKVIKNGVLVWGTEPANLTATQAPAPTFQPQTTPTP